MNEIVDTNHQRDFTSTPCRTIYSILWLANDHHAFHFTHYLYRYPTSLSKESMQGVNSLHTHDQVYVVSVYSLRLVANN